MRSFQAQPRRVFRELIREFRVANRLTQAEVAGRLGVPQSYVSKYESGERRLDFIETFSVCRALGVSLEVFARAFVRGLGGSDPRKPGSRKRLVR